MRGEDEKHLSQEKKDKDPPKKESMDLICFCCRRENQIGPSHLLLFLFLLWSFNAIFCLFLGF